MSQSHWKQNHHVYSNRKAEANNQWGKSRLSISLAVLRVQSNRDGDRKVYEGKVADQHKSSFVKYDYFIIHFPAEG